MDQEVRKYRIIEKIINVKDDLALTKMELFLEEHFNGNIILFELLERQGNASVSHSSKFQQVLQQDKKERKQFQEYLENQTYQASMAMTMKTDAEEQIRVEERENLIKIFYDKGYNIQETVDFTGFDPELVKNVFQKLNIQSS